MDAVTISSVAAVLFGYVSYLFSTYPAKETSSVRGRAFRLILEAPLAALMASIVMVGIFAALISDQATFSLFNWIGLSPAGVADPQVQTVSMLLTVAIALPLAAANQIMKEMRQKLRLNQDAAFLSTSASHLMMFVATCFGVAAAVLARSSA
jgi:hypothetical protein